MLKKIKDNFAKIIKTIMYAAGLFLPALVYAQSQVETGLRNSGLSNLFGRGYITSSTTVEDLIANVIYVLLLIAGAIAVLFVIIGGFWYLTSGGNEETAEKGKKTVINAIIGIAIIILSYVIINVIVNTVSY